MRSPPGAFAGLGVARSRAGKGGGDPARGGATPNGVLDSGKGLQAMGASARERGDRGGAHQARNWAESWCSSAGGRIRAAALGKLRGPGAGLLLRASDPLESLRHGTAEVEGGREDRSWAGGEELR